MGIKRLLNWFKIGTTVGIIAISSSYSVQALAFINDQHGYLFAACYYDRQGVKQSGLGSGRLCVGDGNNHAAWTGCGCCDSGGYTGDTRNGIAGHYCN